MSLKGTLESKIRYRIKRKKQNVFLRDDFQDIGGYDQIGRILRGLVKKGIILQLGYGVYARSKKSPFSEQNIPERNLKDLATEMLKKLNVPSFPSLAEKAYNEGLSTQVPTGRVIAVRGRISRKIGYNGTYISYEKSTR